MAHREEEGRGRGSGARQRGICAPGMMGTIACAGCIPATGISIPPYTEGIAAIGMLAIGTAAGGAPAAPAPGWW